MSKCEKLREMEELIVESKHGLQISYGVNITSYERDGGKILTSSKTYYWFDDIPDEIRKKYSDEIKKWKIAKEYNKTLGYEKSNQVISTFFEIQRVDISQKYLVVKKTIKYRALKVKQYLISFDTLETKVEKFPVSELEKEYIDSEIINIPAKIIPKIQTTREIRVEHDFSISESDGTPVIGSNLVWEGIESTKLVYGYRWQIESDLPIEKSGFFTVKEKLLEYKNIDITSSTQKINKYEIINETEWDGTLLEDIPEVSEPQNITEDTPATKPGHQEDKIGDGIYTFAGVVFKVKNSLPISLAKGDLEDFGVGCVDIWGVITPEQKKYLLDEKNKWKKIK